MLVAEVSVVVSVVGVVEETAVVAVDSVEEVFVVVFLVV